jgi:hypothetical protein
MSRPPNKPLPQAAPLNFLLGCSENTLGNFELARLAEVSDLRRLIDQQAQAALAGWFRTTDRETLKRAIENPEDVLAWAKEKMRDGQRSEEELVPLASLPPGAAHLAAALRYAERNLAEGKCRVCLQPLAHNSAQYCEKHLALARARESQKKGLSDPGSRKFLYAGGLTPSTHGRQPGTLASLVMNRDKQIRAHLAELGVPPDSAAVSLKASMEAILKCLPNLRGDALTQAQLFEKATIPTRTTGQRALKELLLTERIERTGKGIKSDPYRYFLT